MKRIHLPEVEDFHWFPALLRDPMLRLLAALCVVLRIEEIIAEILQPVLTAHPGPVIDLCSGAGGVMPSVLHHLRTNNLPNAQLLLSDLYPNREAVERFSQSDFVGYHSEPVDVTQLEKAPKGTRTLINSFHHLRPVQAKALLRSARDSGQPLLIYELTDNRMPLWLCLIILPIAWVIMVINALLLTFLTRPLPIHQLALTYVVPVIPLLFGWDGMMSYARTYGFDDLSELLDGLETEHYSWEMGYAPRPKGGTFGIYLLGSPV